MIQIGPGGRLTGQATLIHTEPGYQAALRGDLRFLLESARRRLMALGVAYQGRLVETPNGLTLTVSIGDYTKAQPGLMTLQP